MNKILFLSTLKANFKLCLIFLGIMLMYLVMTVSMFDPENADQIIELMNSFPEGMMKAFGFDSASSTLTGMIASYFYGFLVFLFTMVYCIILGNRLVALQADKGALAYLLTTPTKRKSIVSTLCIYFIASLFAMVMALTLISLLFCVIMFGSELEIGKFLLLNLVTFLLMLSVSSICFLFSCLFDYSKKSQGASSAVLIGFFLLNMISGISDKLEFLKYFSLFRIFDSIKIISLDISTLIISIVYIVIASICYVASIIIFDKKNFSI